jgi:hypothetical protein
MHTSYWVWSMVILTFWNKNPRLSCRRCGEKAVFSDLWKSVLLGWWGIPFGPILTVVQTFRNVRVLLRSDASRPSRALVASVGMRLTEEATAAAVRSFGSRT